MILLDPSERPIIAHRGASLEFPENTMLAFERGLALGADALEFDARLSADGVPVVIHDPTVDRTTDGTGVVNRLVARELADLDAGSGQGIPTVAEVLEGFPKVPCIVEVKEIPASLPLAEEVYRLGAEARVLFGSFQLAALRCFDRLSLRRSASRSETAAFWVGARLGWPARSRVYGAFTVPVQYRGMRVVDEAFVAAAYRRGMPVHVWTIDDVQSAERLRAIGIAGIITNCPDRMSRLARS